MIDLYSVLVMQNTNNCVVAESMVPSEHSQLEASNDTNEGGRYCHEMDGEER